MLDMFNESLVLGSLPLSCRRAVVIFLPKKGKKTSIDIRLILLDQKKAFDRVEHKFFWKLIERFGFSPGLIATICVLYSDIARMLEFNGSS